MEFTGERFIPSTSDTQLEIEHLQRYYSIVHLIKDKVVVDAACGEGYGSFILSKNAKKVIGIDISEETIVEAKSQYNAANIDFAHGSVDALTMIEDHSVDVFVSFETIEHINEDQQQLFIQEIKRVLKEDGILLISTPDKHSYSDVPNYNNPFHIKEFYKEELQRFLNNYFTHVCFLYQKFEIVSMITNSEVDIMNYISIGKDADLNQGKYIIAICGNKNIEGQNFSSVITSNEITYNKMINRILILQSEVEERNAHLYKLDQQIIERDHIVDSLKEQVKQKDEKIASDNQQIQQKDEKIASDNQQIQQKDEKIASYFSQISNLSEILQQQELTIANIYREVEQLFEKKREYDNILDSNGWKFLLKYYKVRDFILPRNSKLKLIAKLLKRTIKEPRLTLTKLNKENLKKFRYYLKTERTGLLEDRIDNYLDRFNSNEKPFYEVNILPEDSIKEKLVFPKVDNPIVSIIIPVYNQWKFTYSCLKSILNNTSNISYEIIIADDVSTDDTQRIDEYIENITVIRDEINRGFLLNCNNAAAFAKGDYIFFLNNDTNVQSNWLNVLVELIESDQEIGMVGSKLVYPDGRLQEAGGIIWRDGSGWNYGRLDDPEKPEYNYVKEVDYISGAAIMIRQNLWQQIGGFDERFVPAYYEDADLAFEVRKLGYRVVLQPKSVVVHFEGISHGKDVGHGVKSHQIVNKEKFIKKWVDTLTMEQFENAKDVFWARDRSVKHKSIVVVDHYVPHYDKDAGGRCTYQYLKLFRDLGFHVIFIGDNFFKHEPYTTELEQMGIEVLYGNWYVNQVDQWIKQNGQYLDYVYLNRPHISIKYIDSFKKYSKAKIIYFGLDLHYIREARNYEFDKNPELLKSSENWKKIEFELCEKTDIIHVVGSFEQETLIKEFPHKLIRNIPLYMFDEAELLNQIQSFENRKNILFVGGFNHKPNYDAVNWFINEIYPTVLESQPNIKLYIVGSNPPEDIQTQNSENIIITGYVSDEMLEKYYRDCRLVVVPLRFGAGVKGKVVEAMFHQVPIITTSIGAEGLMGIDEVAAICDDSQMFASKIIELYDDQIVWSQMSEKSREYIKVHFSIKAATEQILLDFYP